MLPLGLTKAEYASYMYSLFNGCEIDVTVHLLRTDHTLVKDITSIFLDGQVDVTAPTYNSGDIEVSRTAQLSFVDPGKTLGLDSSTPALGSFYFDRMIRVIYSVRCSFDWVHVPVFTGPIVDVSRDGDVVDVDCQGKEYFALGSAWNALTLRGLKTTAMRTLLRRTGEADRYISIPDSKTKLAKDLSVPRDSTLWARIWKVNASLNRIQFYDGRGVFRATRRPQKVGLTLRDGEGGGLASAPKIRYSMDSVINAVRVVGAKGSKKKSTPSAVATPPNAHPLSPYSLGRNGRKLYRASFIENGDLKTTKSCRAVAKDELADHLMQQVDISLECLPVPHLEPYDVVLVATSKNSVRFRANAFSIPLVQSGGEGTPMTIGAIRNLRKPRRPAKGRR